MLGNDIFRTMYLLKGLYFDSWCFFFKIGVTCRERVSVFFEETDSDPQLQHVFFTSYIWSYEAIMAF